MKYSLLVKGIVAAGWMLFSGPLHADLAQPHVSLKVTLDNGSDYKKIKGSSERTREEKVQISINLDNRDKMQHKDLRVEWTIYSHPVGKVKLTEAGHGTKKLNVDPLKAVDFKSDKISISGTPKHAVISENKDRNNKNHNNQNQFKTTEVAASGSQYYGYAVQLYNGGVLLDQAYSQSSLKKAD